MTARSLMVLGTASHVGKSTITAALGRILSDDGLVVAPFKAQNMSLNSAATPDGREIGRAQALQAEACRTIPCAEMNPVLIKPSTDTSAQVILLGHIWGQISASDYYHRRVEELFPAALNSYRSLASRHEIVLLEGAGSPAETNLKSHDIVNMRMAIAANAPCLLVGDIDRGGVFASLLGTLELLELSERSYVRAFIINKFRGDLSLLCPGIKMMEARLGIPCAGVIPHLASIGLEEEDSVSLEAHARRNPWRSMENPNSESRPLRVGVIALPHMANFTDFDALSAEPSVLLAYVNNPRDLALADALVIPGTKQTIDDLEWLSSTGFTPALQRWSGVLIGLCGGMQILGEHVEDIDGTETGLPKASKGLGLLPIRTRLNSVKVTRYAAGTLANSLLEALQPGTPIRGYEIHLGMTEYLPGSRPFTEILREGDSQTIPDGAITANGAIFGTYLHGIFDDDHFRHAFLRAARSFCGLDPNLQYMPVRAQREQRINRLAHEVRRALDMNLVYHILGIDRETV